MYYITIYHQFVNIWPYICLKFQKKKEIKKKGERERERENGESERERKTIWRE